MSEQNKELWRQFTKVWDAGDVASFGDLMAGDVVDHGAFPGTAPGLEGVKQLNLMLLEAFPDRATEVHEVIAEKDQIAALHTARATNTGPFMGMPATGRPMEVTTIHIARIAEGKIAEHYGLLDQGGLMMQLGLMPMPPGTESWRPPPTSPQVKGKGSGDPNAARAAMQRMVDAMRAGRQDEILEQIAPDVVDHAAMPGQGPGKDGVRWRFEQLFAGMTEPDFVVQASVGEGPYLSQAYTFSATHTGPMMGMPPTNKPFQINAIDFVRFENGKMREHWGLIDIPSMMMQLGLMPPPA